MTARAMGSVILALENVHAELATQVWIAQRKNAQPAAETESVILPYRSACVTRGGQEVNAIQSSVPVPGNALQIRIAMRRPGVASVTNLSLGACVT
jgi:hypothetical protein